MRQDGTVQPDMQSQGSSEGVLPALHIQTAATAGCGSTLEYCDLSPRQHKPLLLYEWPMQLGKPNPKLQLARWFVFIPSEL